MPDYFKPLPYTTLSKNTSLYKPLHLVPNSARLNETAITVMTDLKKVTPFSIEPLASIEEANEKMISCGVRLLFVIDSLDRVYGLITATDILGERPIQYLREHGGNHSSILVQDIMTRRDDLEGLSMKDIENANVGDIVETLRYGKRQHMLVYENYSDENRQIIRGIISSTQVERQLGIQITKLERADNFADLEQAIMEPI